METKRTGARHPAITAEVAVIVNHPHPVERMIDLDLHLYPVGWLVKPSKRINIEWTDFDELKGDFVTSPRVIKHC